MTELNEIATKFKEDNIKLVELQFTDIFGRVKSTTITAEKLIEMAEEGLHFDGSSVRGFARLQESDQILKPDLSTYTILPWKLNEKNECRFICDVLNPDGKPFEGDPRFILKKMLLKANELGFTYFVGTEQEFDLFDKTEIDDLSFLKKEHRNDHYFDFIQDTNSHIRRDMIIALERMGMTVEMSHQECASDQQEIDIKYSDALHHADDAITFRYALKQVARKHNKFVSFMPKSRFGVNGSGMHTHQSLFDLNKKTNLFFDENDSYCLSETAYNFMAGQLKHIKAIAAITNPIVNSYKRLTPGYEAACYVSWARMNRSALIRIPSVNKKNPSSVRLELRNPDPSCNPYLSFAVLLAAGLEGIKNKMKAPEPREENIFEFTEMKLKEKNIDTLPASLKESLDYFKESDLIKKTLGEHTFNYYLEGKIQEWNEFRLHVTDWEYKKYLKVI
ncbi:MAG: type I glutamate--ammonia ligase [Candidatus Diapherotrites archaeon]|nr:type I glutamate--ammonia ligase [Candidatus Diapherotrites archaeon]